VKSLDTFWNGQLYAVKILQIFEKILTDFITQQIKKEGIQRAMK